MAPKTNTLVVQKQMKKVVKLVPPDGGWGWMVIAGSALCNVFNQSMLSLFSLLYGDALEAMGHKTQGAAVVLSTMLFVTNFGGPIAGIILKLTTPRFVALLGACSCTLGIFLSGFSTNIIHLVLTYGVLLGLGLGFLQNSTFVAMNAYFKLKKGRAVGLAMVGTGIGQSLMPHVVRYLLENYDFRGACMILGGLSLNGIAGVLLIQPVEWHMKKEVVEIEVDENFRLMQDKHKDIVIRKDSIMNGANDASYNGRKPVDWVEDNTKKQNDNGIPENNFNGQITSEESKKNKSILSKIYDLLDISLLSNFRFLNIIIGTSMSVTSIQNFSMLFPLFLQKMANMDKQQTAMCMSAVAMADIGGRLILPLFQDRYKIKARWMIIMTSVWLIVVRQILAYQTDLQVLLVISAFYGFGRSMIIVARNIAISEYCRMDQVPAAVGLGMLAMGTIVPPAGYFLGWIRDYTGSYIICITAQNILLVFVLVTWIPDMLLLEMKEKRNNQKAIEQIPMS